MTSLVYKKSTLCPAVAGIIVNGIHKQVFYFEEVTAYISEGLKMIA